MPDFKTNIQVMRASRKKPMAGDVFAIRLPDETHLFGRVIGADIKDPRRAPMPGAYLIYIYNERSVSQEPDLAKLTPDRLLLAPVFINQMPWTKGYFATVAQGDLKPSDRLEQHCFWRASQGIFVDENRTPLPREVHPCGEWGLASYRLLDDLISDALGMPRVPGEV